MHKILGVRGETDLYDNTRSNLTHCVGIRLSPMQEKSCVYELDMLHHTATGRTFPAF